MKVTLSKSQWESIGIHSGWMRIARFGDQVKQLYLNQGIEESIIDRYIQDFDVIRKQKPKQLFNELQNFNIPKDKRHDITSYRNFRDLEVIVDYVKGQRQIKNNDGKTSQTNENANKIYEENNLIIYRADNAAQAIDAKGDFEASWCVSAQGTNNMFNSYKYAKDGNEPTFYFVKDLDASKDNPYRFFVIQTVNNGYIVTSANNDGDKPMSWEEIVKAQPKLDGKQNIIKWIAIPQETKERLQKYEAISDDDFKSLPYEQKKEYIEYIGFRGISDAKFSYLHDDLKNLYINFGLDLTENQFNEIKNNKQLYDRYAEMWARKIEKEVNTYKRCPKEFKNDPRIQEAHLNGLVEMIKKYPSAYYRDCPEEFKNHPRIQEARLSGWIKTIGDDLNDYKKCPEELKNDPRIKEAYLNEWVEKITNHHPSFYEDCPEELKNDPRIKEACLNGWVEKITNRPDYINYKHCPEEFKNHPRIQEAYLNGWIKWIKYYPPAYDECPNQFKNHPEILNVLPESMKPNQIISSNRLFSSYFNDNYIGKIS